MTDIRNKITAALQDGELYIGLATDPLGKSVHHLILLPGDEQLDWQAAQAWAKAQGGELPTRTEALLLFHVARDQFKRDWYWTSEQRADVAQYAWYQGFDWGDQSSYRQGYRLRVRAVRRVAI